jgi:hypothetical protein
MDFLELFLRRIHFKQRVRFNVLRNPYWDGSPDVILSPLEGYAKPVMTFGEFEDFISGFKRHGIEKHIYEHLKNIYGEYLYGFEAAG